MVRDPKNAEASANAKCSYCRQIEFTRGAFSTFLLETPIKQER